MNEVKKPPSKPSKGRANNDYQSKKELDSIIKKANNKVSSTERKILDLENKKSHLEEKMNLGTTSPDVFSQFNKVEAQLLEVMSDWERATEELEVLENKRKLMFS